MHDSDRQPKHLSDYSPPDYLIETVDLDMRLEPQRTIVHADLAMKPNPQAKADCPLALDGEGIKLLSIALDGRPLQPGEYSVTETGLTVSKVPTGLFTLSLVTACNPEANEALLGLYRSNGAFCTQCEPEGFRRITYFLDRPDVLATYRVRLEADKKTNPVLLANGNPVGHGEVEGTDRHYAVWEDPFPKPSYLFAAVAGDLAQVSDSFTTRSGREVALNIYVEHGKEDRCGWAMESLKNAMRWDEERFGREYDLEVFNVVAVSDFNMGAMENKGLNIFNDKLVLARPDTASDADYAAIEGVIAHEYFHNWTGNRITCRDWFQLCLKEGLTVFRDQEFSADLRAGPVKRILDVRMLKSHQFPEDSGPLAHPVRPNSYIEINNFYTATVYEKGAELCRMLQTMLGRENFRKGLDLYFERHDGQAVTVEDFLAALSDASGKDLTGFMRWYNQAGTPELACSLDYDAQSKTATLNVSQILPATPGQPNKEPMPIPLRLGLLGPNGNDLPLALKDGSGLPDGLLEVSEREQSFTFIDIPAAPTPSLLREFSAPVRLTLNLDLEQIEFLMMHDSDPFNRWQAAQSYAIKLLTGASRDRYDPAPVKGRGASRLAMALALTASQEELAYAYRAEMMKLPSESDIARELARNIDTDAIRAARETLRQTIGQAIHDDLADIYRRLADTGPYSPDGVSAGKRSMRIAALDLLVGSGNEGELERAVAHYRDATNMTDAIYSLLILAPHHDTRRDEALADFYERWKDDALVLDKWFAVQARTPRRDSVEIVERLLNHPKFSLKNPNRVRALIASFANGNPTGFNRKDGGGYELVAECALRIDKFNPHMAARLLGAFESWRILEPARQAHARASLEGLANAELSTDSYEIVSKTLGDE